MDKQNEIATIRVFESNQIFRKIYHSNNTKYSKINELQNKWIEYKIFTLKYRNTRVTNVSKYEKVKLVLEIFHSTCLY